MKKVYPLLIMFLSSFSQCADIGVADIDFVYQQLLENHPGVDSEYDPMFRSRLETYYTEAKQKAKMAKRPGAIKNILNDFVDKFDDCHLKISWNSKKSGKCGRHLQLEKFKLTQFQKEAIWITIPTFKPSEEQYGQLQNVLEQVKRLPPQNYVVFDIRGNGGGDSTYSEMILKSFFGKEYVEQKICQEDSNILWRTSNDNVNYLKSVMESFGVGQIDTSFLTLYLEKVDATSEMTNCLEKMINYEQLLAGILFSYNAGSRHWLEEGVHKCAEKNIQSSGSDTKFIIITSEANASCALIFVDSMYLMTPNLVLLGEETSGDTMYTEIRKVPLLTKRGWLVLPIKQRINRKRQSNETYKPDIPFEDINNTEALRAFVREKINAR